MNDSEDLSDCEPFDETSDLVVPPAQVEEPAAVRVSYRPITCSSHLLSQTPCAADPGHWCNVQRGLCLLRIRQAVWFPHSRHFFALDVDEAIDFVPSSYHTCQSVKSIPRHFQPLSSDEAPKSNGISFAADVARCHRQLILVFREAVSLYTLTTLIKSSGSSPPPSFTVKSIYSVPMSECYNVASMVLAQSPQGPICCLYKPSSLPSYDDADPVILPPRHSTGPTPSHVVTSQPTKKPRFHHLCMMFCLSRNFLPPCTPATSPGCSVPSGAPAGSAAVVPPRRPGRQRLAPFWHNQDWDLD